MCFINFKTTSHSCRTKWAKADCKTKGFSAPAISLRAQSAHSSMPLSIRALTEAFLGLINGYFLLSGGFNSCFYMKTWYHRAGNNDGPLKKSKVDFIQAYLKAKCCLNHIADISSAVAAVLKRMGVMVFLHHQHHT